MTPEALLRKAAVLVVDDLRSNLLAMEAVLGADYNVLLATSGAEALAMLGKHPDIDVVLLDVNMPVMDGFETAARIKKMEACRDLPIVFVTAVFNEDPFVKKGYEVGGIDYFSKPFDPDILKMKVGIYASFRTRAHVLAERERHVRESQELLRVGRKLSAVLRALPVGVLIADSEGGICQATDEVSRILRASGDPVDTGSYGQILEWWKTSGQIIKDGEGPLARALRAESSHSEAVQIRCFDASIKTILVSASPLRGLDGRVVGAVVLIQDMTETGKIEKDLQERVTKLVGLGVELEETAAR